VLRRVAGIVALCAIPATASANGRFPAASQLVVDPTDSKHLALRTTYGLVLTFDAGSTWKWVCETSPGYSGVFDPALAFTKSGRLLVPLPDGLSSTTDRACSFARASLFEGQLVVDLVSNLALTKTTIAETTDNGATWTTLGTFTADPETIEVAPSRPQRIYISDRDAILVSDDRGKTFERYAITGGVPYLAAIDPNNADVVYVRVDGDATKSMPDRLMISRDGAKSWSELGRTTGEMLAFALSPDGSLVIWGGPNDGLFVDGKSVSKVHARCLLWAGSRLYVCGTQSLDGFTVGVSEELRPFAPLYRQSEVTPLECAATTSTGRLCPREWPGTQLVIGVPDDDAGPGDASVTPSPPQSSGCGCATAMTTRTGGWLTLALAFALLGRRGYASRRS
jgi:hypothetical protein